MNIKLSILLAIGTLFAWFAVGQTNEFRMVNGQTYDLNNSPEWKIITIPAGSGLENTRAESSGTTFTVNYRAREFPPIHFDGTTKPIKVGFILPEINSHTRNISVSIANFPYTPECFKEGQLRIVEPVTPLTIHYDVFRGLVTKSNLVLRVFPLRPSYSRTNYDALGHVTVTTVPAQPIFDYGLPVVATGKNVQTNSIPKGDVAQISLVAGIYQFANPNIGMVDYLDLRSDGTAQKWRSIGYSSQQLEKKNVNWAATGDTATVDDSTFKIEGNDLIDANGNRWLRIH